MKIVFSRKGFDSTYGGAPSPIIAGKPVSLPIPAARTETTTYAALGLGEQVTAASRGRMTAHHACHDDPMFADGLCWLGQNGAAQGHLRRQEVGEGDVFLFFGLFADPDTGARHHRLFGCMTIACTGSPEAVTAHSRWNAPPRAHPHLSGDWGAGNTIWHGSGYTAQNAGDRLRLTCAGGPLNLWNVPGWLRDRGLTYHGKPQRWPSPGLLNSAKRGQEFVCDIADAKEPRRWLDSILAEMSRADLG